jgi:hypothetical protein
VLYVALSDSAGELCEGADVAGPPPHAAAVQRPVAADVATGSEVLKVEECVRVGSAHGTYQ